MFKLKLCYFKFLGIFSTYFKRKFMNTVIHNHLKNEVENRIKEYDKDFELNLINNLEKPCCIKYASIYQGVVFPLKLNIQIIK